VQVLCSEGIANHTGPESCAAHREVQSKPVWTFRSVDRLQRRSGCSRKQPLKESSSVQTS